MEVIALILVIVLAVLSNKGKKQRSGQAGASRTAQANPKPVNAMSALERQSLRDELQKRRDARLAQSVAQPTVKPQGQDAAKPAESPAQARLRQLQSIVKVASGEGEPMLDDGDCLGGSMEHTHTEGGSALDDPDCAGGSMEHTHTEGVSRSEQARRMAAIDAVQQPQAASPERIDAQALRRAIVMAEVLGRPRALKRR